ncbi:penicillin amidase, partial [Streptomyces sp. SID4931]|nr:penicillin amidase [Streptomyces sp. SID4931]
ACPEFDVVGLAVPGIPGIAHFGHTGHVAWAITNAMADYQDLYREQVRRTPDGGVEALGPAGWYRAHAHTETIEVAGAEPERVEVIETDRGPVIIGDGPGAGDEAAGVAPAADGTCISLRYPPRVTGELGFDALPALLRARTVADVDTALDRWVEPVNVVLAADTAGSTLHRVAGHVPVRPYANRLRVVPAEDPAYAWREGETVPLPRTEADGSDGIAVMANERGLAAPLGVEFAPPH